MDFLAVNLVIAYDFRTEKRKIQNFSILNNLEGEE